MSSRDDRKRDDRERDRERDRVRDRDRDRKGEREREKKRDPRDGRDARDARDGRDARDARDTRDTRDKHKSDRDRQHRPKDDGRARDAKGARDSGRERDQKRRDPKDEQKPVEDKAEDAVESEVEENDGEDEAQRLLEESRRRRAQILQKYAESQPQGAESDEPTREPALQEEDPNETFTGLDVPNDDESGAVKADEFDMFNLSPSAVPLDIRHIGAGVCNEANEERMELADNWDDAEGYYAARVGEVLNRRYVVAGKYGRGVFSTVLKCLDMGGSAEEGAPIPDITNVPYSQAVAVKVIRANDHMYKSGLKELEYLCILRDNDTDNRKHTIRMIDHFDHRGHLCIVFEPMEMNLRELLKRFGRQAGREVGLHIEAVRVFAKQLFTAVKHMKDNNILHGDLKLDNVLVNQNFNVIKLGDFGSASTITEGGITPYLVSRYYRPPEVILGLHYDNGVDVWSAAVTVYELYTGRVMFDGSTNNMMLNKFMEFMGKIPNKMLKKGEFVQDHFTPDFKFKCKELDPISKKEVVYLKTITTPTKSLRQMLLDHMPDDSGIAHRKRILQLADFLTQCLQLDPARRMKPDDALRHEFLTGRRERREEEAKKEQEHAA